MLTRKAVVVETGKGWAIVLLPGGEYKRIKTNQYLEVGELYRYRNYAGGKYLAAAAIFLVILLGSIDYYTARAYAEVSSLELGINRWGRVISVEAKDDEGQRIISKVKIKNEPVETAVQIISQMEEREKPDRQTQGAKPSVKIHAKGGTKPELEDKILEKINQGQEKADRAKENNRKKPKTEPELREFKLNKSDNEYKPDSPGKTSKQNNGKVNSTSASVKTKAANMPELNKNPANPSIEKPDTESQSNQSKVEKWPPVDENASATQNIEVPKPGNGDKDKEVKDSNPSNNRKNDNNRKKQGE